jgi:hypothetical protein
MSAAVVVAAMVALWCCGVVDKFPDIPVFSILFVNTLATKNGFPSPGTVTQCRQIIAPRYDPP